MLPVHETEVIPERSTTTAAGRQGWTVDTVMKKLEVQSNSCGR
jgi:hypothetical protein